MIRLMADEVIDLKRSSEVKSSLPPHLKLKPMLYELTLVEISCFLHKVQNCYGYLLQTIKKTIARTPELRSTYKTPAVEKVIIRRQGPMDRVLFTEALSCIVWEPMYQLSSCREQFALFENNLNTLIDVYLPLI